MEKVFGTAVSILGIVVAVGLFARQLMA